MTAANGFDVPLPFALKQEKDEYSNDDEENDDDNCDDASSVSSLAQPSILDKNCFGAADPKDEFLRLTSMVRRVYFSYLHKSVISNYNNCCQSKEKDVSKFELKKFAGQMELCAVKSSLEASLYRQTMLKMISDIKSSTSRSKIHKKLTMFLETPPSRVDAAVQTTEDYPCGVLASESSYPPKDVHIQSAFVTSNFDENLATKSTKEDPKNLDERITALLKIDARLSPKVETKEKPIRVKKPRETHKIRVKREEYKNPVEELKREIRTNIIENLSVKTEEPVVPETAPEVHPVDNQMYNDMQDIFGKDDVSTEPTRIEEEESQDSLMQHLEDMFCESDDSSDLMTLIEKHSGVTKANIDSEIGKMCPEETIITPAIPQKCYTVREEIGKTSENTGENTATTKRKLSFSNYKKMKKRAMGEPETPPAEETAEERQIRKVKGIWFVERVHQVSKLKAKMMELSVTNYRKHGRLRQKFIELFGDSDEEEMMPDSPIHIEEHLTACKERIAPWVVKHLMPFYTKRVIRNRLLFKAVAKHIADMMIIENTFPEEKCVGVYVADFFRNKTCIKAESDIYI